MVLTGNVINYMAFYTGKFNIYTYLYFIYRRFNLQLTILVSDSLHLYKWQPAV